MIKLNLNLTLFIFLGIQLGILILYWYIKNIFNNKQKEIRKHEVIECEICFYVYENIKNDEYVICPRCGSYNKRRLIKA